MDCAYIPYMPSTRRWGRWQAQAGRKNDVQTQQHCGLSYARVCYAEMNTMHDYQRRRRNSITLWHASYDIAAIRPQPSVNVVASACSAGTGLR